MYVVQCTVHLPTPLPTQLKLLNTFSFIAEVTNRLSTTQLKLIMLLPYSIELINISPYSAEGGKCCTSPYLAEVDKYNSLLILKLLNIFAYSALVTNYLAPTQLI